MSGYALSSIDAAQAKAGDLRGAFSTSLRIAEARVRFKSLLSLVTAASRQ